MACQACGGPRSRFFPRASPTLAPLLSSTTDRVGGAHQAHPHRHHRQMPGGALAGEGARPAGRRWQVLAALGGRGRGAGRGRAWAAGGLPASPPRPHTVGRSHQTHAQLSSCPPAVHTLPPSCQPQTLNKAQALKWLKARLLVVAQEQQLQEVAQIRGDLVKAGASVLCWRGGRRVWRLPCWRGGARASRVLSPVPPPTAPLRVLPPVCK